MFDKELDYAENFFEMLAMLKNIYDSTGEVIMKDQILDAEYYYEFYSEAFSSAVDDYECVENEDDWSCTKLYLSFMFEYYMLCRQYTKQKHISFENNPYVKEAEEFVNEAMLGVNDYSLDWSLCTPEKESNKDRWCLMVVTYLEFQNFSQLICALYDIREYFALGVERIKTALAGKTEQSGKSQIKERKTAA